MALSRGMNARKAEQRQAEQDQMRKQEFDLQQEARRFDLANAKTNAENSRVDRERTLASQACSDAFSKHFGLAMSSPDDSGAIVALANGFNDPAFGMPYRAIPKQDRMASYKRTRMGSLLSGIWIHQEGLPIRNHGQSRMPWTNFAASMTLLRSTTSCARSEGKAAEQGTDKD